MSNVNVIEAKASGVVLENPSEIFSYADGSKKQYCMVEVSSSEEYPQLVGKKFKGIRVISNKDGSMTKSPVKAGEEVSINIKATPGEEPVVFVNSKSDFTADNHLINSLLFG